MKHLCHAIGCGKAVPPRLFMCPPHWRRLPKQHQDAIWASYRKNQESTKLPSLAYIVAQTEAVLTMAILDGRSADELNEQRRLVEWAKRKRDKYGAQQTVALG